MGNPRGFLDIERKGFEKRSPKERLRDFKEFVQIAPRSEVATQASRCMNCGVPFCQAGLIAQGREVGCPLKNLIPEFNDALYKYQWREAFERLSLTNPFPEFTGRVCPAPCEDSCVCAINSGSVTIKANELAIIENAFKEGFITPKVPKIRNGKKIAIVGSGPAALACAYELNNLGFLVSVFERDERVGGLLMYGIPDMKLDKSVIERRVKILEKSGIKFRVSENIDSKAKADRLLREFDAVILAVGASKPIDLKIKNREARNIVFAVDFLRENTRSLLKNGKAASTAKGKNVLVIGSGDTSVDCVAVATRQGAKSITRFERSPKRPLLRGKNNPWPLKADVFSTDYGLEEAIYKYGHDVREYQKLTKSFLAENDEVQGAMVADLKREFKDAKPINVEIKGSEKAYKADLILLAMGFEGVENEVGANFGIEIDNHGNIKTGFEFGGNSSFNENSSVNLDGKSGSGVNLGSNFGGKSDNSSSNLGSNFGGNSSVNSGFGGKSGSNLGGNFGKKTTGFGMNSSSNLGMNFSGKLDSSANLGGNFSSSVNFSANSSFGENSSEKFVSNLSAFQSSKPKIFACGDARMGQSLVVWAIRDGLECARAVNAGLG